MDLEVDPRVLFWCGYSMSVSLPWFLKFAFYHVKENIQRDASSRRDSSTASVHTPLYGKSFVKLSDARVARLEMHAHGV